MQLKIILNSMKKLLKNNFKLSNMIIFGFVFYEQVFIEGIDKNSFFNII